MYVLRVIKEKPDGCKGRSRYAVARALRDSSLMLKLGESSQKGKQKERKTEESGARAAICPNPSSACAAQRPVCAMIRGHGFILLKVRSGRSAPDHTARAKKGVVFANTEL